MSQSYLWWGAIIKKKKMPWPMETKNKYGKRTVSVVINWFLSKRARNVSRNREYSRPSTVCNLWSNIVSIGSSSFKERKSFQRWSEQWERTDFETYKTKSRTQKKVGHICLARFGSWRWSWNTASPKDFSLLWCPAVTSDASGPAIVTGRSRIMRSLTHIQWFPQLCYKGTEYFSLIL